jgi:hypothetical protein
LSTVAVTPGSLDKTAQTALLRFTFKPSVASRYRFVSVPCARK